MSAPINTAAGERTLNWVDEATRDALTGWDEDRVLVRMDDADFVMNDEWTETTDLLTGQAIAVRRADCGAGCRCAAEVKLVGVEPPTPRNDPYIPVETERWHKLQHLHSEVHHAAPILLGVDNGGTWGSFTCTEIEALAAIFRAAGREDVADFIISEHAESDEDDDMHTQEEPNE